MLILPLHNYGPKGGTTVPVAEFTNRLSPKLGHQPDDHPPNCSGWVKLPSRSSTVYINILQYKSI